MRKLTMQEVAKFAGKRGVKKIAVENFLMTVHNNRSEMGALMNMEYDARVYGWNDATVSAIREGIHLAGRQGNRKGNKKGK